MTRRVFYSFHYQRDNWRTAQVRNIGVVEGDALVLDNLWEQVKRNGDRAIQKWIDDQMKGRSCTIVLIGAQTAGRKWINYEIKKSWNDGKGLLGIYIHNLKDQYGYQSIKGKNPFDMFEIGRNGPSMSDIVRAYDPPYVTSTSVYNYIRENLVDWVEEAISIRQTYDERKYIPHW